MAGSDKIGKIARAIDNALGLDYVPGTGEIPEGAISAADYARTRGISSSAARTALKAGEDSGKLESGIFRAGELNRHTRYYWVKKTG